MLYDDFEIRSKGVIDFGFGELRRCSSEGRGDVSNDRSIGEGCLRSLPVGLDDVEAFLTHLQCGLSLWPLSWTRGARGSASGNITRH